MFFRIGIGECTIILLLLLIVVLGVALTVRVHRG